MLDKIKHLSKQRRIILYIIGISICGLLFLGITYAFYHGRVGDAGKTNIDLTGNTVNRLSFDVGSPLTINATSENFSTVGANLTSETSPKAILKVGNAKAGTENYFVYFNINSNDFVYSSGTIPEIILTITDENGNAITSITGLTYGTYSGVTGFDITTKKGKFVVAENHAITGEKSATVTHNWNFKITFLALASDQSANEGKTINAKIMMEDPNYVRNDVRILTYTGTSKTAQTISSGGYTASVTCNNTAVWNNLYWGIDIDLTKNDNCKVTYTKDTTKNYLNTYVSSLAGTTQGTGEVVNENGIRYEGKNPNNYVWFNNELWRIIGTFDTVLADGTTTQSLVKIIKDEVLSGLVWNKKDFPNWNTSSLKAILNGAYYNKEDGTDSGYCYGSRNIVTSNCDYTNNGISSNYRPMIKNVTWNLGGSIDPVTTDVMYGYERGTTVYSGNPTTGTGYIGLIYPSDYGYSVLAGSCGRTTNLYNYGTNSCAGSSWLYGNSIEWTLTPSSYFSDMIFSVDFTGGVTIYPVSISSLWRPVLYLDTFTYVTSGSGTRLDPYIVRM